MTPRATIKRLARRAVSWAAFFSGYCFLTGLLGDGRAARILCYHGINDRPANSYAVSTPDFARQMRFLAERCTLISVERLADLLREGEPIPPRAVAVTIDDGYRDVYTNAYPILARFAIPATIFLPVELIGTSSSEGPTGKLPQPDFLSWDQVREVSRDGIACGSHTLTHLSLTSLTRRDVRYQLESSKAKLETEIGKPVTGFSYPFGTFRDFNSEIKQLVAATGYSWAVTIISGVNNHKSDLFALRRTMVQRDDGLHAFEKAMGGSLDPWIVMQWLGRFFH
jgi:peptidoglycan/xylan/chitin deacetylase (PgdA/CDA1 family)